VRHAPEDYKTGNAYGARPDLELDPRLYPALEQWLFGVDYEFARDGATSGSDVADAGYSDWGHRAALAPTHDFVFTRPNGSPWTVSELSRTFSRTSLRLTGKKTNPHLVRDMVVTHVRGAGLASDAELEALAMYMGHSVAMQKGTYDRRTTQQKVAPAVGLMSAINARAGGGEKKADRRDA
jgi:integrase